MLPKGVLQLGLLTVALTIAAAADLPSCERAKCHHCKISFIAKKCPEVCAACEKNHQNPEQKRTQRPTYVVAAQQIHELLQNGNSGLLRPISEPDLSRPLTTLQQQEPQTIQLKLKAVYNKGEVQQQQQQFLTEAVRASVPIQQTPTSASQPAPAQIPVSVPSPNPYQLNSPQQFVATQPQTIQQSPYLTSSYPAPQQTPVLQQQPIPPPPTLQQTPAFNPFQPFLTQTFNALPGANLPPLLMNPYTPLPLPTFAPVTPQPIQYAQTVQQPLPYQPYQSQPQPTQYYQYPINEGHPSVVQKPSLATKSVQVQKTSQPVHVTHPELNKYSPQEVQTRQNPFPQQKNIQHTVNQPQPQPTFYATKHQPKPLKQTANTMITANKSIEKKVDPIISEQPSIQTSIDGPTITLEKSFYTGEKPHTQQQCPRQPNWQPCISKQVANERFRNCCLRLGEGCSSLCSYDSTLATIQLSVLTGRCPLSKVGDMMVCASGYEDATPCCEAHNVFEPGFEHCKPYCNPAAGLPQGGMLTEKFKCLGKLSQIQRCFYVTQRP